MASTAQININVNSDTAVKSVGVLNDEIVSAGGSANSLRAELKKTVLELQGLQEGSARFKELSLKAGTLKDQITDTNAVVAQLAGNFTERLTRGITGVVQIGVAGFQAIAAGMALFGDESEDLTKTMVKLQALLNLSNALESFAGIDQKIVEIRAAFTSLTVATETQAVATEVQAVAQTTANIATETGVVATTSLTTSTTALGLAMKALPIIGLAAALATLAYGIYQYASSNSEAKKTEEQRKKALKDLNDEQKKYGETIAKESTGFLIQIERLRQTTALSKERSKIIGETNKQFGTTLQNIKDEGKFQEQLNLVVADYIAYQTTKYQLTKNEEVFNRVLERQLEAQKKYNTAASVEATQTKELNRLMTERGDNNGILRNQINSLRETTDKYNKQNESYKKQLVQLGTAATIYSDTLSSLTKNGTRFGEVTKDNTDKVKDQADALKTLEGITNAILGLQNDVVVAETEVLKLRVENGNKTIDLAEREKKQRIDAFTKTYNEIKLSIENEIKDQKLKTEKLKILAQALSDFTRLLGEKEVEESVAKNEQIVKAEKTKNELLLEERKTLQTEIEYADSSSTDNKIALINRELDAQLKVYDTLLSTQKVGEDISLQQYEDLLTQRQSVYEKYIQGVRDASIAQADAEYQRTLKTNEERLNADKEYLITLDENGKYKVKLTEDREKEISKLSKEEQQLVAQNARLVEENLNQTKVNLAEELVVQKKEIDGEYLTEYKTSTTQTEQEITDARIKQLDDYLAYAAQAFNEVSQIISEYSQQQMDVAQTQLDDTIKLDKELLDSQLSQKLISREEYDNKIIQLDQQQAQKELQLKRKNFRTEKALNMVGATIDGARAVLGAFAGTTGGIVVKTIAATLAGVFAATQIALISTQEFKAARGGIVPGNGSGQIDSVPSRLAPGEAVINSSATAAFLPLLSAINESSGGKSFMPDLPPSVGQQKFQPVFNTQQQQTIVKAYVVESDLSQVQKRINRIERSTSF
jgi:hypothetical protein